MLESLENLITSIVLVPTINNLESTDLWIGRCVIVVSLAVLFLTRSWYGRLGMIAFFMCLFPFQTYRRLIGPFVSTDWSKDSYPSHYDFGAYIVLFMGWALTIFSVLRANKNEIKSKNHISIATPTPTKQTN